MSDRVESAAPRAEAPLASLRAAVRGRTVLVTGATGFKGSWLSLWLRQLEADVVGYSLPPATTPAAFDLLGLSRRIRSIEADVRDAARLRDVVAREAPVVVFHMAAQALVRPSYEDPLGTFEVNVMGTANVLEAVRLAKHRCAVVVVTSDKCYENREHDWGYREIDPMGGHDPYAASKGAAELVASSWRRSFFPPERLAEHGVALASARAGNVIGGGDWARDRIVPDIVRAFAAGRRTSLRNPGAIRPWQHVLEPLGGYLALADRLLDADPARAAAAGDGWNFGPLPDAARTVKDLATRFAEKLGAGGVDVAADAAAPHEAAVLRLAIDRALARLAWRPRWSFEEAVDRTAAWYAAHARGADEDTLVALTREQIAAWSGTE